MLNGASGWRSAQMIRRRLVRDPLVAAVWAVTQRRLRARPELRRVIACNSFCHFFGLLLFSHTWAPAIALGIVIAVLSVLDYAQRPIEWVGIVLLVMGFARAAGALIL